MRNYQKKKLQKIGREKIDELFKEAEKTDDLELATRYIEICRKLAMKYNIRLPPEYKRKFCKHCKSYLKQGINVRVRRTEKGIVYTCLECDQQMRFPVKDRVK